MFEKNIIEVSIIIPLYNEEENIPTLINRLVNSLQYTSYEVILIDDGSIDKSRQVTEEVIKDKVNFTMHCFECNQGQSSAIKKGIEKSKGLYLIIMDGDLQNHPEDILKLVYKIKEGYDLVSGKRTNRQDPLFLKVIPSLIANVLLGFLFKNNIRDQAGMSCVRSVYAKQIDLKNGYHRFIPLLVHLSGGKCFEIPITHSGRKYGFSKYKLISRIPKFLKDVATIYWKYVFKKKN